MLYDMHCHLSLMQNAVQVAGDAEGMGLCILDCGCEPAQFVSASMGLGAYDNLRIGVGLHPWWLRDGRCTLHDAKVLAVRAESEPFIGEVGLDFSKKGLGDAPDSCKELQLKAFELLCKSLAKNRLEGRVASMHAVQATNKLLDMLEEAGLFAGDEATRPAFILHWFSGSSEELARARSLGCYFSVSELMMRSKRGREYARQIPAAQLLPETDAPPQLNEPYSAQALADSLNRSLDQLAELRQCDRNELAAQIEANSQKLFQ